jgi:hypothetical protein
MTGTLETGDKPYHQEFKQFCFTNDTTDPDLLILSIFNNIPKATQ